MIPRRLTPLLIKQLQHFPAVALLGCRQVGKTTLALELQQALGLPSLYLDLETPSDRAKLLEPQLFLESHRGKLLILDEIQHVPDLFAVMRGVIDRNRQAGYPTCQFLVLGSASPILLKQSSESLAGRIACIELDPLNLLEIPNPHNTAALEELWLRGGFPSSFLNTDRSSSFLWRMQFIRSYVERDLQSIGRLPASQIHRLWKMLAYDQGTLLNASKLAMSLGVAVGTVRNYLHAMEGLFLLRSLQPWSGNSRKRLVKAPKLYLRDSGLVHALTHLQDLDDLLGHSLCGFSWEGFVIEQILTLLDPITEAFFYRSSAGAELDLLLELQYKGRIAIEIKRTLVPKLSRGFIQACEDVQPDMRFFIMPYGDPFPIGHNTTAIGLHAFLKWLAPH